MSDGSHKATHENCLDKRWKPELKLIKLAMMRIIYLNQVNLHNLSTLHLWTALSIPFSFLRYEATQASDRGHPGRGGERRPEYIKRSAE